MANYNEQGYITSLEPNECFVFGSNKLGNHAGGAARQALEQFGAIQGQSEGLQGQSYAIPTLDGNYQKIPLTDIQHSLETLVSFAKENPDKTFYLTDIGCGIAGNTREELESILPPLPNNIIKTWS